MEPYHSEDEGSLKKTSLVGGHWLCINLHLLTVYS